MLVNEPQIVHEAFGLDASPTLPRPHAAVMNHPSLREVDKPVSFVPGPKRPVKVFGMGIEPLVIQTNIEEDFPAHERAGGPNEGT
jgi:hypothetical protein